MLKFCLFSLVGQWAPIHPVWALAAIHPRWGNRQVGDKILSGSWALPSAPEELQQPDPSPHFSKTKGPLRISAENFAYFGFWEISDFSWFFDDFWWFCWSNLMTTIHLGIWPGVGKAIQIQGPPSVLSSTGIKTGDPSLKDECGPTDSSAKTLWLHTEPKTWTMIHDHVISTLWTRSE